LGRETARRNGWQWGPNKQKGFKMNRTENERKHNEEERETGRDEGKNRGARVKSAC